MDNSTKELCHTYIQARHQNPAWQILAARRGPLVLSCLKPLFAQSTKGIEEADALQRLAEALALHANDEEFDIRADGDDYRALARKELRDWIRRGLVVEREGKLVATDALQRALDFVGGLGERIMTSTASRLGTVQREIENLETRLNPDPQSRVDHLRRKITALEEELAAAHTGDFTVLQGKPAVEGIREIYNLAISLQADFRRVEDSYREADRRLRQTIISEQRHRGEIVDSLLDSHDQLLETPEGQVFHGFYQQLHSTVELDNMKHRLRNILRNAAVGQALNHHQQSELRWLIARLVGESANVIRARARSERDVKGFIKTGLAAEHHRVGELLREILEVALEVDWSSASERRRPAPLPPVGIAANALPLVERLRFKSLDTDETLPLILSGQNASLSDVDQDFWAVFDSLDRGRLLQDTLQLLSVTGTAMSIADIASHLPPSHDLETLSLWLSMARETDAVDDEQRQDVDIVDTDGVTLRFNVPRIALTADAVQHIEWEL